MPTRHHHQVRDTRTPQAHAEVMVLDMPSRRTCNRAPAVIPTCAKAYAYVNSLSLALSKLGVGNSRELSIVVALTCVFVVSSVVSREYDIERVLVVLIGVWWLFCCLFVAL